MFGWRWEQGGPWDSQGIEGVVRFLSRVWDCVLEPGYQGSEPVSAQMVRNLRRRVHQAVRRGTQDMEAFAFNTFVANLMELNNSLLRAKNTPVYGTAAWGEAVKALILMLARPVLTSPRNCGRGREGRTRCTSSLGRYGMRPSRRGAGYARRAGQRKGQGPDRGTGRRGRGDRSLDGAPVRGRQATHGGQTDRAGHLRPRPVGQHRGTLATGDCQPAAGSQNCGPSCQFDTAEAY